MTPYEKSQLWKVPTGWQKSLRVADILQTAASIYVLLALLVVLLGWRALASDPAIWVMVFSVCMYWAMMIFDIAATFWLRFRYGYLSSFDRVKLDLRGYQGRWVGVTGNKRYGRVVFDAPTYDEAEESRVNLHYGRNEVIIFAVPAKL